MPLRLEKHFQSNNQTKKQMKLSHTVSPQSHVPSYRQVPPTSRHSTGHSCSHCSPNLSPEQTHQPLPPMPSTHCPCSKHESLHLRSHCAPQKPSSHIRHRPSPCVPSLHIPCSVQLCSHCLEQSCPNHPASQLHEVALLPAHQPWSPH